MSGGLPPAPPSLWDPRAGQQQLIIPTNPVGSAQGTFRGNEYLFVEQGNAAPATQVYDGAYINSYQSQAQGAVYGQPQYSVPQAGQPQYVQPQQAAPAYQESYPVQDSYPVQEYPYSGQ